MIILRIIVLSLLSVLFFIPNQEKEYVRMTFLIGLSSLFLLPVFIKNLWRDILSKNLITIIFILFLIVSAVSIIFSINQQKSITELLLFVAYFIFFTSIKSIFSTYSSKQFLAFLLITSAIILSLISLFNTLILHYVNREIEGASFMWIYYGHNHLSAILVFAIPLALYFLWLNWKKVNFRIIILFILGILLLAMFFTLARGSILALFVALFTGSFLLPVHTMKRTLIAYFTGIVFIIFVLPFGMKSIAQNPARQKVRVNIARQADRLLYWNQAVTNFTLYPLWGTGLDSFGEISQNSRFLQKKFLRSNFVHNFFLQMLSDAGIFGFLTSVGLIGLVLWQAGKKISSKFYVKLHEQMFFLAFYGGIFASALNTLVDYDWQIPTVFLIFWIWSGFFK